MTQPKSHLQCIRHRSVLCQTIKTEEWLHKMAQNGLLLVDVQGSLYRFKHTSPRKYHFFIMTPEAGTNSDVWVFHEFNQRLGKRIPCLGPSFFSPSHILLVNHEISDNQSSMIAYYFQYRNYRLLNRFRRNALCSSIFFFLGAVISIIRFPVYAIALFPYLLVSGFLLLHYFLSYLSFRKDCLSLGYTKPGKRPRRPGY